MREAYRALFLLMSSLLIRGVQAIEGPLGSYTHSFVGNQYEVCMYDKDEIVKMRKPPNDLINTFDNHHATAFKKVKSSYTEGCLSTRHEEEIHSIVTGGVYGVYQLKQGTANLENRYYALMNSCTCGCSKNQIFDEYSGTCSTLTENDVSDWDFLPFKKGKAAFPGQEPSDGNEDNVDESRKTDPENGFSCGSNCIHCCDRREKDGDKDKMRCTTCDEGYFVDDDECKACDVSNCKTCGGDTCTVCKDGFYSTDDDGEPSAAVPIKKCKACPTGCKTCSVNGDQVECDSCNDGYYKPDVGGAGLSHKAHGRCVQPSSTCDVDNCNLCLHASDDSHGEPNKVCKQCKDGYGVYKGKCRECPDNCDYCGIYQGFFQCMLCKESYAQLGVDHTYYKGCLSCTRPAESSAVHTQVVWQFFAALFVSIFLTNQ